MTGIDYCDECGGKIISSVGGFQVCEECGLTFDRVLDDREDPIIMDGNIIDQFKYHGEPIIQSIPSISTAVKPYIPLRMKQTKIVKIIKKYSYSSLEIIKTNLVFLHIKRICSDLNLDYLYVHCCHLFKKINKTEHFKLGELKGTLDYVACSIIYLQANLYDIPIFYYDFEKIGYNNRKIIRTYVKKWSSNFQLNISPVSIKKYLWKILNYYINDTDFKLKALLQKNILKTIKKHNSNLDKRILIFAIIYTLLYKFKYKKISLRQIEKDFGVSYISVWNYTLFLKNL